VYYDRKARRPKHKKIVKKRKRTIIETSQSAPPVKISKTHEYCSNYELKELSGKGSFYFHDNTECVSFGTYSQCDIIFPASDRLTLSGEGFSDTVGFVHARITKDLFNMFKIERVRESIIRINGEELLNRSTLLCSGDVIQIHTSEFQFV